MNYQLYKVNIEKTITRDFEIENIKNLEWEDSLENVFISFSFTTPTVLNCGDKVELYNIPDNVVVWYGVITTVEQTTWGEYQYSGYDVGFYLLKNELTTQYSFNKFQYILEDVCRKCELRIGEFPDFQSYGYTHIYRKETAEKILKDAYKNILKYGVKDLYYFDCKDWRINLKQYSSSDELKGAISLLGQINSFEFIKDFNIKDSIVDLKNYVEIFTDNSVNNKNTDKPDGFAKNDNSIEKYGLLRYSEDLDKDCKKKPQTVAVETLAKLNKVAHTITLSVWGNYRLQKGIITTIEEKKLNFSKNYKVVSSKHKISAIDEEVTIEIEKYEG